LPTNHTLYDTYLIPPDSHVEVCTADAAFLKVNSVMKIGAFVGLIVHFHCFIPLSPSHISKVISLKNKTGEWSGFFGKVNSCIWKDRLRKVTLNPKNLSYMSQA
jgi:hypothetical protein